MESFQIKEIENRNILTLPPSPFSGYSIFFYTISLLLVALIIYICLRFFPRFILAFGLALIPIALLIFNFKINIWNLFGKETIVIHPKKLTSTLDYKYIYKKKTSEFPFKKLTINVLSSKDGAKLALDSPDLSDHKKNKFRIIFEEKGEKIYQTSNFISYTDLLQLKSLLN